MKRGLFLIGLAFAITLAIVFGLRASVDALAVVIGVFLGVIAGVPTTFLIVYVLMRTGPNRGQHPPNQAMSHQPPVVVINASDKAANAPQTPPPMSLGPPSGRKWTVIGDSDTD